MHCHLVARHYIYVNYRMLSCCKGIIYVNYAMPCCLANHLMCKFYQAILFSLHITFFNNVITFNLILSTQRMSCSCVSGPPRTKNPFSVMIFCHRSIMPPHLCDTRYYHNYRHRSVISMIEKNSFGPKCHGCVFFVVLPQTATRALVWP